MEHGDYMKTRILEVKRRDGSIEYHAQAYMFLLWTYIREWDYFGKYYYEISSFSTGHTTIDTAKRYIDGFLKQRKDEYEHAISREVISKTHIKYP